MSRANSPLGGGSAHLADGDNEFRQSLRWARLGAMNDDDPPVDIEALKTEHRRLDEEIAALSADPDTDQLELARLKRRKLRLKDEIQLILDSNTPDIIA